MKKILLTYVVIPAIMFAVFIVFYRGAVNRMEERTKQQLEKKAISDAAEAKRKKEIDDRAQADAKKRQDAQDAADALRSAEKEAAYRKAMTQLRDEAADYNAQADKLAKEVGALDIAISQARSNKEKLNRETFDLSKEVELAKINRRNAEIEIQRMVEIAGKKMADSSVAIPPPPPPLVPAK